MESPAASIPASILETRLNLLKSIIADIRLQSPIKAINLCPHCYVMLGKTLSRCKHRQDNCFDLHPDKRPTRPTISAAQQVKASIEVATAAAIKSAKEKTASISTTTRQQLIWVYKLLAFPPIDQLYCALISKHISGHGIIDVDRLRLSDLHFLSSMPRTLNAAPRCGRPIATQGSVASMGPFETRSYGGSFYCYVAVDAATDKGAVGVSPYRPAFLTPATKGRLPRDKAAECRLEILKSTANAIRVEAGLPASAWAECLRSANFIRNLLPSRANPNNWSSYQMENNGKPFDVSRLRGPLGTKCYVYFGGSYKTGTLIGWASKCVGYRVLLNTSTGELLKAPLISLTYPDGSSFFPTASGGDMGTAVAEPTVAPAHPIPFAPAVGLPSFMPVTPSSSSPASPRKAVFERAVTPSRPVSPPTTSVSLPSTAEHHDDSYSPVAGRTRSHAQSASLATLLSQPLVVLPVTSSSPFSSHLSSPLTISASSPLTKENHEDSYLPVVGFTRSHTQCASLATLIRPSLPPNSGEKSCNTGNVVTTLPSLPFMSWVKSSLLTNLLAYLQFVLFVGANIYSPQLPSQQLREDAPLAEENRGEAIRGVPCSQLHRIKSGVN